MSISVEFPNTKPREPSQGSAGLRTHIGGACTTVSALMEASKAIHNEGFRRKALSRYRQKRNITITNKNKLK